MNLMYRYARRTQTAAAWGVLLLACAAASAEDIVFLTPTETPGGVRKLTGTITEFTGKDLFIRTASGRETSLPASRVESFSTVYTPTQLEGDRLFGEGKYIEALTAYRQAMHDETRTWVRRQILAQICWCFKGLERYDQAGSNFLLIWKSDPTTPHLDALPLLWHAHTPDVNLERQAKAWAQDTASPPAQLLGASILLSAGPTDRAEAQRTLETLTSSRDTRIAALAQTQLWRSKIVTASADDVAQWQRSIAAMPESLRAGGYFLLGKGLARLGEHEKAATALMRLPINFPRERRLAAEGLLAAAESLEKIGQTNESQALLEELIKDFPDSTAAAEVKTLLHRTEGN